MTSPTRRQPPPRRRLTGAVVALGLLGSSLSPASAQAPRPGSVQPLPDRQTRETVEYLRGLQADDGGFFPAAAGTTGGTTPPGPSNLRATTAALRALKYFGGSPRDAERCAAFVGGCYDRTSGGFAPRPGATVDVVTTAAGVMALAELKRPSDQYKESVLRYLGAHADGFEQVRMAAAGVESLGAKPPQAGQWLQRIAELRNAEGTFGSGAGAARMTGGAIVAWLRLGGTLEQRVAVLRVLGQGQRSDGGFGGENAAGSDLDTTYRVMRAFHVLKALPPDPAKVREFITSYRNADGGYGLAPGQPSGVGPTYYAGIVLHWLNDS